MCVCVCVCVCVCTCLCVRRISLTTEPRWFCFIMQHLIFFSECFYFFTFLFNTKTGIGKGSTPSNHLKCPQRPMSRRGVAASMKKRAENVFKINLLNCLCLYGIYLSLLLMLFIIIKRKEIKTVVLGKYNTPGQLIRKAYSYVSVKLKIKVNLGSKGIGKWLIN